MPVQTSISVTIGGANVGGSVLSLGTEQDICRIAQTCTIALDPNVGTRFNPWDEIAISINGTPRFSGYVDEALRGRKPAEYIVRGTDVMKRALDNYYAEIAQDEDGLWWPDPFVVEEELDAGYWIDYWLKHAGISTSGPVQTGRTVPVELEWNFITVSGIILECLGYAGGGWTVIIDGDGVAQISRKLIAAVSHTLTGTISFSRSQEDSWRRDRAVVFGYGVVAEKPDDPTGCIKTAALSSTFIQTQGVADGLAQDILDFFDEDLDIKRCLIAGDASIWLGETAAVSDSWTGYSGMGLITSIVTTVDDRGFTQSVSLDEKCGFIWGGALRKHWSALERISWVVPTDEPMAEYPMIQSTGSNNLMAVWWDQEETWIPWRHTETGYYSREYTSGSWEEVHRLAVSGANLQRIEPYLGRRGDNELHLIGLRRPEAGVTILDQYYHPDPVLPIYGPFWIPPGDYPIAQQFTCGIAGTCEMVKLLCYRDGACGDITVQIRNNDPITDTPGSSVLAQGTLYQAAIPLNITTWRTVGFAAPAALVPGTKYWIYLPAIGNYYFRWGWATEYFAIGYHTGGDDEETLTDSEGYFTEDYVGRLIENTFDGSSGIISAFTHGYWDDEDGDDEEWIPGTLSVTLAGGIDNDWDTGDAYILPDLYNRGFAWSSDPSPPFDYAIGDFGFQTYIKTAEPGNEDLVDWIWDGVQWAGPLYVIPGDWHGLRPHTAEDANGILHLVNSTYEFGVSVDLHYTYYDGLSWATPIVLDTDIAYYHPRIHVDSAGRLYVVYAKLDYGLLESYLYVKRRTNGTWGPARLLYTGAYSDYEEYTSFIDGNDQVHLILWDTQGTSGSSFMEIKGAVGNWIGPGPILMVPERTITAIGHAVGKSDSPDGYFLFYGYDDTEGLPPRWLLFAAECLGGEWSYTELETLELPLRFYFTGPTIVLDSDGRPHAVMIPALAEPYGDAGEVYYTDP